MPGRGVNLLRLWSPNGHPRPPHRPHRSQPLHFRSRRRVRGGGTLDGAEVSELLIYIRERDVGAYTEQGWICTRLSHHHGGRKNGKNFMAVIWL